MEVVERSYEDIVTNRLVVGFPGIAAHLVDRKVDEQHCFDCQPGNIHQRSCIAVGIHYLVAAEPVLVPEPATLILLGTALLFVAGVRRTRYWSGR